MSVATRVMLACDQSKYLVPHLAQHVGQPLAMDIGEVCGPHARA